MLFEYFDRVKALMPNARPLVTAGVGSLSALLETVAAFAEFLD
ncbi:hypothetical protein [Falsiroseomonas sp. HW251]